MSINEKKLSGQIESLLLAAGRPLAFKRLAELCKVGESDVNTACTKIQQEYQEQDKGYRLILTATDASLVTDPANSQLVAELIKQDDFGELTKPQLEALTVIAYRGPITKFDLENIRGVNCSMILRNLQIRGLVENIDDKTGALRYQVTTDFLRYLGLSSSHDLPNFETLSSHAVLERIKEQNNQ